MQNIKQRNVAVSIAKCIGICLMVIAHCSSPEPLRAFIGQFHMPLFFVLSGYFFIPKKKLAEVKSFVWKRVKKLWWPYLYWGVPFLLVSPFLVGYGYENSGWDNSKDLLVRLVQMVGLMDHHYGEAQPGFWFLKTLFHSSILIAILSYICQKLKVIPEWTIIIILLGTACCLSANSFPVLHKTIFGAVYAGVYILIGYYYRKIETSINLNWVGILVLLLMTIIGSQIYRGHGFLNSDNLPMVISSLVFSVSGTLAALGISVKLISLGKVASVMAYIGDNTLIILALHAPVIRLLNVCMVYLFNMPSEHMNEQFFPNYIPGLWIIFAVLGIAVPIVLKWLSSKIIK